jgi:hypothetical protein
VITCIYLNVIFTDPAYVLLPPCQQDSVPPSLHEKIATCLATRFDAPVKDIRSHLRTALLRRFGKVQRLDGGDLMNASTLVAFGDDRRDATFVRVSCIIDPRDPCPYLTSMNCSWTRMRGTQSDRSYSNHIFSLANCSIYSSSNSRHLLR